jgi:hypothetical protein
MKTKFLLLAAVILVAGIGGSLAQTPTFSVNAVGHVVKPLVSQYNLLSNPLNGTNNQLNTIIPVAPEDSFILRWDPDNQTFVDPINYIGGAWDPNATINRGEGFFLYSAAPGTTSITLVGEVPQGTFTNLLRRFYNLIACPVPQAIDFNGPTQNFPANEDDFVLFWIPASQTYSDPSNYIGGAWDPPVVPEIGGAFFYYNASATPHAWVRTFSVN